MNQNIRQTLALMNARAQAFHALGNNRERTPQLQATITEMLAAMDPQDKGYVPPAEQAKFMQEAWKDPRKMQELCELRVETVNNYIRATSNFLGLYFQEVSLGVSDTPEIVNETANEISCGYISQEGKPRLIKIINPRERAPIPLKVVSSERPWYFLYDIYNGDVSGAAKATFDIAFDLRNKLDLLAYQLLTASLVNGGVFGAFVTTGSRVARTYVANSRIVAANLPSTNDITLSSTTAWPYPTKQNGTDAGESNRFRLDVIQATMAYCDRWAGVFKDGDPRPTGLILVPSIDASDLRDLVLPTGATSNPIADALMQNYTRFQYLGVTWTIMPDPTLPAGACFPILTKPAGRYYTKPSHPLTREVVKTMVEENREERSQQQVAGFSTPVQLRPNALRITYSE